MKNKNSQVADTDTGENHEEVKVKKGVQKKKTKGKKNKKTKKDQLPNELFDDLLSSQKQVKTRKRLRKEQDKIREESVINSDTKPLDSNSQSKEKQKWFI